MSKDFELLEKIVLPIVADAALELFDLTVKVYRGTANIEILIDHSDGGISLDECAHINRKIVQAVEEEGFYGDDYGVSVSSPGLDWPLKNAKDFRRLIGRDIDVKYMVIGDAAERQEQGTLQSVNENSVLLKTAEGEVDILLEHIRKADVMI